MINNRFNQFYMRLTFFFVFSSFFPVEIFYLHNTQCARRKYARLCECDEATETENSYILYDFDAGIVDRWLVTFGKGLNRHGT